jgi:hypothetical protein
LDVEGIASAVADLDTDTLDVSRQSLLEGNLPSADECIAVQQFVLGLAIPYADAAELQKKLGNAQYFVYALQCVSDFPERFRFVSNFHVFMPTADSLLKHAQAIIEAAREIQTSPKLPFLFRAASQIASFMDGNSFSEVSKAFRLSSLLKLMQTKGRSGETVESYLVTKFLASPDLSEALELQKDLTFVDGARLFSFAKLNADFAILLASLTLAEKLKTKSTNNPLASARIDTFIVEGRPKVEQCKILISKIDESLRNLFVFLGEDPTSSSPALIFGAVGDFEKSLRTMKESKRRNC